MVKGLLQDGKLGVFNEEHAVVYQVRNAENVMPSDFDVKISVTANIGSLTIYVMISDGSRVISNSIVVLTYEGNFQITKCVYADADVYAVYDVSSDVSFVLDSSKIGYNTYRTQVDTELENFKNKQSIVDVETNFKNYL